MLEHAAHVAWDPPLEHESQATMEPHGACDCFRRATTSRRRCATRPPATRWWGVLGNRYHTPAARPARL
jgi:hypothetical protein